MRKLIFASLLMPLLALSQNSTEYSVFENDLLTPNPTQIGQFEKGITAHNKKYHNEGPTGVRVYWISTGPRTGSYVWVMGPLPWSSLDSPAQKEGHAADWRANVAPYLMPGSGFQTSFWKFNADLSFFPKDFTIKNMAVDTWDIKRGKYKEALTMVKKVHDVNVSKSLDDTYGIYTNEFPSTKEGRDLAVISFFDKSAWLGENHSIEKKYEEMYGAGSWDKFLGDWMEVTNGGDTEIWMYRPDLSGISGDVKVAERK
ncbi:hypothetical protein K8089_09760 [Aequorivita sp. F47161]|uniref:Uncharacterized protein n=1 Tax=Aequorivita vitellina TaxID=2874475 RepID=A0A9X1QY97_9FLAO|nr:hypothetical protein [Aequorivita vitellina]MCG2419308.1 hypothetical protein [Aequorivita vitellina]